MNSFFKFLSNNKLYTAIVVTGLALALMFVILLGDFTWRQFSIDSWHRNADRITMIGNEDNFFFWPQAADEIKDMCPEVESVCRLLSQSGKLKSEGHCVEDKYSPIILITDQSFFDFFDFKLKSGDRNTVLDAPDKCVITETLAGQLFPGEDAMGKSLQIVGKRQLSFDTKEWLDTNLVYNVAGIIEDLDRTVLPVQTRVIVNMERYPQVTGYKIPDGSSGYSGQGECKALFMVKPGLDLESKRDAISKHMSDKYQPGWVQEPSDISFTPLEKVMFAPQNVGLGLQKGDRGKWKILLAVILAVLLFAVTNYVNLTVANSGSRAKEMGTRLLLGSSRRDITLKLMSESALMVSVTFLLGLALAFAFQKDFSVLFNGIIALEKDVNAGFIIISIVFVLGLSFITGSVPGMRMASVNPLDIVKGGLSLNDKTVLNKIFISIQCVITVVMLSAVLTVWLQFNHLAAAPMGFNYENMFQLNVPDEMVERLESRLAGIPGILDSGHMGGSGLTNDNSCYLISNNGDNTVYIRGFEMDRSAFEMLGFQLVNNYGQAEMGYYLNEEALRQMGLPDDAREFDTGRGTVTPLSGVVRDFHLHNVLGEVEPVMIRLYEKEDGYPILIKTDGSRETLEQVRSAVKEMGIPDEYVDSSVSDMSREIEDSFYEIRNMLDIVSLFTLIAVFISIMGFAGMSLSFIRQRRKEIATRRVFGGSIREVVIYMLAKFCAPLLVSCAVAVPLAYLVTEHWLRSFSWRIQLSPWIFIAACASSLLVAVLSILFQTISAVDRNPSEAIKSE